MTDSFNEISIELTHKCSLGCVYCSSESSLANEITLDYFQLINTIREIKNEFDIKIISLSGGESFMYPNFKELIDFLVKLDLKIIIYTSGVIIDTGNKRNSIKDDYIELLSQYSDRITIVMNIQGYNSRTIEKINGVKNSFRIIKDSISKLNKNNILLEANVVPFKDNYETINEIVEFCINNDFKKIHFLRFVPQGRGNNPKFMLNQHQFKTLTFKLISLLENNLKKKKIEIRIGNPLNFLFLFNRDDLYKQREAHYCRGCSDAPIILPDGDVSMCPAWKNLRNFNVGNIYKTNFKDIWYSENFKLFREFVKTGYKQINQPCQSCKYIEICRGKCVAQRILCQNSDTIERDLKELLLYAPDPNCFRDLMS